MNRKNISSVLLLAVLYVMIWAVTCHAYVSPKMSKKLCEVLDLG